MKIRVCFVCLGNICRSPTAEGILLRQIEEAGLHERVAVESAGTSAFHAGQPADPRSLSTAEARGVPLPSRSRQFVADDYERFDYVVAMDGENLRDLLTLAPDRAARAKVALLRAFDSEGGSGPRTGPASGALDVPDPYYGERGFDRVFDICEAGCRGLLAHLIAEHDLSD